MKKILAVSLLILLCACGEKPVGNTHMQTPVTPISSVPVAQDDQQRFALWLTGLRAEAMGKGVSQPVLDEAFTGITPSQDVLSHDHTQPEQTKTFADYLKGAVTQKKIDKAKEQWQSHADVLARIEAAYGVPAPMLLALWGTESGFGHYQGHYSIIESLTTLAYDGRRSAFFRTQLIDALLIVQQEHIPAASLTGSWAGAMGQTQFMPSSFLSYAVDFDGDGKKDIWHNDSDALASIANYLHSKGWDPKATWGIRVSLPLEQVMPTGESWKSLANKDKPLREWRSYGIVRSNGDTLAESNLMARLILPDGDPAYAYLAFANYKVIMDWNHSTYFATAVGLLADGIRR